jgi:hypothetical protein
MVNDPRFYSVRSPDNTGPGGPLPAGRYHIGQAYAHRRLGNPTFNLDPLPGTDVFGGTDFRAHSDTRRRNRSASSGCEILPQDTRRALAQLVRAEPNTILEIVPGYPQAPMGINPDQPLDPATGKPLAPSAGEAAGVPPSNQRTAPQGPGAPPDQQQQQQQQQQQGQPTSSTSEEQKKKKEEQRKQQLMAQFYSPRRGTGGNSSLRV